MYAKRMTHRMRSSTILFMLAFAVALSQALWPSGFGFGPGWEAVAIARTLALTGTYGDPFQTGPSGATAVIAPLFPAYLAVLIRILGDSQVFAMAAIFASLLAQSMHAALLPRVSAVFFGGNSRPGIFAGLLSAFAFRLMPQWDAALTSAGLLLFFLKADLSGLASSALSGVAVGLLMLMNPSTILITGPWLIYSCWNSKAAPKQLLLVALVTFAVTLPWMLRNEISLGTFSLKDNFGMTAYASNNDCADPGIDASIQSGCYNSHHPNTSIAELRALNRLGEAGYDKLRTTDTLHWVQSHLGVFAQLTLARIRAFWFPPVSYYPYATRAIWLTTLLSAPGMVLIMLRCGRLWRFFITVATAYPILYYVVVSDVRYRYPLLWLSCLCAGYFLSWIIPAKRRSSTGGAPANPRLTNSGSHAPSQAASLL